VTLADTTRGESMSEVACAILSRAPPRFALIGYSLGGYVAFEMLRRAPERVSHLVLLGTSARCDSAKHKEQRLRSIALAREGRLGEIADLAFPRTVDPSRYRDESLRRILRAMAEATAPDAFVRQQLAALGRKDSREDLSAIRCPTLVLVGESDQITPPELSREMARAIHGAELVTIPGAGHAITVEAPGAVNQALFASLTKRSDVPHGG
jgi:pimeloyl-ACP methyl ester carboxylesterase